MKQTPIIFSTKNMKAIMEGYKTMTRRVIKPQPECLPSGERIGGIPCRYGKVGDSLWCKETHYRFGYWIKNGLTKTGRQKWTFKSENKEVRYFDNPPDEVKPNSYRKQAWYKRPAIFMPRWASRITLEITNTRVERVQDINEKDAIKEGIHSETGDHLILFQRLWDIINTKRGFSWESNPWCWVIEFKRVI